MRGRLRAFALAAVAGIVLLGAADPGSAAARSSACPGAVKTLSPRGPAAARFTMLVRVNKPSNALTYASPDEAAGGLGGRIRPQDVFIVNTRFRNSSPSTWTQIVATLRSAFPCNRIVTLNGLGGDPSAPGYALALVDAPGIWGVLTDWEQDDWKAARLSNPFLGTWTARFRRAQKRVRRWMGRLTARLAASPRTRWRRVGLVPQRLRKWDYGLLARGISGPQRQLAPRRRGIESVQSQDACAFGGPHAMASAARGLRRQYKRANFHRKKRKVRGRRRYARRKWRTQPANLGMQISFTGIPEAGAAMALLRTPPQVAAWCTRAALRRGAGAFLYWASPESMRLLFSTPVICALRPPRSGAC